MWPKALLELLPHLTRLVPLVNRYFQNKSETDNALRTALERKLDVGAAALRVDIEKSAEANERLLQLVNRQAGTLAQVAEDTRALRLANESLQTRLSKLEESGTRNVYLFAVLVLQFLTICILAALFLFVSRR